MATQTNNYNLTLREANDYFNPMLPTNENMEKIDEQMKANDDHSVTTATELVTGTVHALTRLNTDCAVFRFTATSNYEAGHTFTVDGVQVTALLTNGTTIPTGAYIIGSEVLCVLKGTLLTIMASGASLALDSNKLDGHTADYYAKNSELTSVSELATKNGERITTLNNSLNMLCKESKYIGIISESETNFNLTGYRFYIVRPIANNIRYAEMVIPQVSLTNNSTLTNLDCFRNTIFESPSVYLTFGLYMSTKVQKISLLSAANWNLSTFSFQLYGIK